MNDEEKKVKHLEMIEAIIERMGKNSFQLKGWAVTLVTVIGGLAAQGTEKRFFILAFVPTLAFWMLDAFYLQIERKYKNLYKKVQNGEANPYDLDTQEITARKEHDCSLRFMNCMFSPTIGWFYIAVGGTVLVLARLIGVFSVGEQ